MPKISEAAWAEVRARYETTIDPVRDIAKAHGITHVVLWRRAKKLGWTRPDEVPPVPEGAADDKLLGRLFRAFERQIADLEQRFLTAPGSIEEKDARTLSVLAKTFETLAKMRDERGGAVEDADVDLDDLRARLAERLAGLGPPRLGAGGADGADGGGHH